MLGFHEASVRECWGGIALEYEGNIIATCTLYTCVYIYIYPYDCCADLFVIARVLHLTTYECSDAV